jgi:TetR/AcrR family transcriptional regulator, regulator of autoinduction and epiphytic fitness
VVAVAVDDLPLAALSAVDVGGAQGRAHHGSVVREGFVMLVGEGYARTTIRAIAEHASVAPDTVYATFGSKARVLTAVIDRRLVPDDSVANVTERPEAQAIRAERDQRHQLELFAEFISAISSDLRPVFEILRTASAVEPEMVTFLGVGVSCR